MSRYTIEHEPEDILVDGRRITITNYLVVLFTDEGQRVKAVRKYINQADAEMRKEKLEKRAGKNKFAITE